MLLMPANNAQQQLTELKKQTNKQLQPQYHCHQSEVSTLTHIGLLSQKCTAFSIVNRCGTRDTDAAVILTAEANSRLTA